MGVWKTKLGRYADRVSLLCRFPLRVEELLPLRHAEFLPPQILVVHSPLPGGLIYCGGGVYWTDAQTGLIISMKNRHGGAGR